MPVLEVSDAADERLADYRDLTDVALRRSLEPERGLYMAEGAKVIARAIGAGHAPRSVLVSARWLDSIIHLVPAATPVFVAPDAVLDSVTGYNVHRGALAAMNRPALPGLVELVADATRVVVLEDVVDHTNVGAIFRSAAGIGADAVVVSPRCADPLYRRSVKVSMGTVFQVPWTRAQNWPGALDELRELGFVVAGLALRPDAVALDEFAAQRHERVAIVMGTEGDGLTRQALAHTDTTVVIPMRGGVDSLNVAAAAAVAMWELTKRVGRSA